VTDRIPRDGLPVDQENAPEGPDIADHNVDSDGDGDGDDECSDTCTFGDGTIRFAVATVY
jgi:hypothetical protein